MPFVATLATNGNQICFELFRSTFVDSINVFECRLSSVCLFSRELFWTSAEKPPSIRKSFYDGTNPINIITSNIVRLGPIAVDVASDQLFFSDLKRRVIEVSSLSGENRRTLLQDDFIADLVSIAVMDNDLYLATDSEIRRMETNTSHESDLVSSYKATAIIKSIGAAPVVNEMDLNDNPCAGSNGNCSHLCIPGQGSAVRCACPRELVLKANQITCSEKLTCKQEEFLCTSGDMCIPKRWRCDGTTECSDQSDELGCEICNVTQYNRHFCEAGQCKRDGFCNSNGKYKKKWGLRDGPAHELLVHCTYLTCTNAFLIVSTLIVRLLKTFVNSLDPDHADKMSVLIWIQTV